MRDLFFVIVAFYICILLVAAISSPTAESGESPKGCVTKADLQKVLYECAKLEKQIKGLEALLYQHEKRIAVLEARLHARADKEEKRQVWLFTAKWCDPCQRLKRELEKSPAVEALASHGVHDIDVDEQPDYMRKWGIKAVPTYVLTTHDHKELKRDSGYRTSQDFAEWLEVRCKK